MSKLTSILCVFILITWTGNLHAQQYQLASPDGANQINVYLDDHISYTVIHNGKLLLDKSPVSITVNGQKLGDNPRVKRTKTHQVNEVITPVVKEKFAQFSDQYNMLSLDFRGSFGLDFKAYNDGIAYRFRTAYKKDITVDAEEINYRFTADYKTTFPIADGFFTHYERGYTTQPMSKLGKEEMSCLPVMVHLDGGVKAVISEADLYDYPGYYLKNTASKNSLNAVFPLYPKKYEQPTDRDVKVPERETYLGITNGTRTFPWRFVVISDTDKELIENTMVFKLSSPLKLENADWIRPGKVAWDWYNANNIYGVDFESGVNTETYKYYIDFASKYGLDYIILDEGWYDIKTNDLIHPVKAIDMEALVAYGKEKNVDLILWVTWKALEDQLEAALAKFSEWNIKGIKVDFMQRDDQWMVRYYEKIAKRAADYKMLVDFHGSYKPSGLRRAYPNVISREGVRGLEQHKWEGQFANPEHDVELPFMRMLTGPMDYTPGAMVNAQQKNYFPVFDRPMALGTRCHQLAMYVVFESPLQMLADSPSNYLKEEECMEFLSVVPSTWEDTKVLHAQFGDYVAIARKNGNEWYVGAMTDWDQRDLDIDFSFLGDKEYTMEIYRDGVNAERYASDYKKITKKVNKDSKETIHLASGGGWVARIY